MDRGRPLTEGRRSALARDLASSGSKTGEHGGSANSVACFYDCCAAGRSTHAYNTSDSGAILARAVSDLIW